MKIRTKPVVELEYNPTIHDALLRQKITVYSNGKTSNLFFAGIGIVEDFYGKRDLYYKTTLSITKQARLTVRPQLIREYLNAAEHKSHFSL